MPDRLIAKSRTTHLLPTAIGRSLTRKCVTRYSVSMNITMSLDDELLAAAKSLAARRGTSVTGLVRSALEQKVAVDDQIAASGSSGVLQTLTDYSMGKLPRSFTMKELGIEDYGSLLQLMNAAGLPLPIVPIAIRKAMAQKMVAMLGGSRATR